MALPVIPHSPLGAQVSFDFGPPGAPAGLAVPTGSGRGEGVFVGCRAAASDPWSLLPFFNARPGGISSLPKGRFGRFFAAAGDKWMIGPLVFKIVTPFPVRDEDDERFRYAPVVCGYLEYDNSHSGTPAELVFGLGGTGQEVRGEGLTGFQFGSSAGFAAHPSPELRLCSGDALFGPGSGDVAGLRFAVPAHARRVYPIVIGFHQPGFHFSREFADLASVLSHGLAAHARYLAQADARDAEFMRSALDFPLKVQAAEDLRTWLAHSRRLASEPGIDLSGLRAIWRRVTG